MKKVYFACEKCGQVHEFMTSMNLKNLVAECKCGHLIDTRIFFQDKKAAANMWILPKLGFKLSKVRDTTWFVEDGRVTFHLQDGRLYEALNKKNLLKIGKQPTENTWLIEDQMFRPCPGHWWINHTPSRAKGTSYGTLQFIGREDTPYTWDDVFTLLGKIMSTLKK